MQQQIGKQNIKLICVTVLYKCPYYAILNNPIMFWIVQHR